MELSLHTEQKQLVSQKMIQSLDILQMAAAQLKEYMETQLLENPVMELDEKHPEQFDKKELEKYQWISSHDEQNRYLYQKIESTEEELPEWNLSDTRTESLRDYLWSQLLTKDLPADAEKPIRFLLESLDYRGYFTDSLETFARQFRLTRRRAEELLSMVRSLEPAGVGARNLQDCLCIQLERQGELSEVMKNFVNGYLPELAKNQLPAIAREMKIPVKTVEQMAARVRELDPKPGSRFSDVRQTSYILPDVVVVKFADHFDILLNESLYPDIFINREYIQMCEKQEDPKVREYLTEKIRQAEWLKQCIAQRNLTLFSVAQEMVSSQAGFFRRGPSALKPLRQADVARKLGINESTVSRAVREKYLQCSWGIFPLQYFFAKTVQRFGREQKTGQETASATVSEIKNAMEEIIRDEDKQKPYSDRMLSELLEARGFSVSRRTVAKYREEALIPPASGRKKY